MVLDNHLYLSPGWSTPYNDGHQRFQGLLRSHSPLIGATVTLITYVHIGVTDHTLAPTFFTLFSGINSSLLAAKDQVQTSPF